MNPTVFVENTASPWPGVHDRPLPIARSAELERSARTFLTISAAFGLSHNEERTLLDLSSAEMVALRRNPAAAFHLGGSKLERRVNYAIPILQRMIAAIAS